jgi:hypothetical protein
MHASSRASSRLQFVYQIHIHSYTDISDLYGCFGFPHNTFLEGKIKFVLQNAIEFIFTRGVKHTYKMTKVN